MPDSAPRRCSTPCRTSGLRPDVAVVGEPTWLAVTETLRGYALVDVAFVGRAAHSSQPELGVNAVGHLGRFLAAVDDRHREVALTGGSLLVTVVRGGDSPFVLARSAEAVVERRTVPGEDADVGLAEVERALDRLRARGPDGRRHGAPRHRPGAVAPRRRRAGGRPRERPRARPGRLRR